VIGTAKGWTAVWVLAIALATHSLLPYYPFPQLSDYAFAATLARGPALAGLALGAAAHAEPVTALHGALAVAAACAATGRPGLRALGLTALAGCTTALPVIYSAAVTASGEAIPAGQLIEEGYLFAAPEHYRLARAKVLLGWGYLALGAASAVALRRERPGAAAMVLGLLAGLGLFQAAATLFRAALTAGFAPLYMLDATRSSPLYFALSATLFAAAAERQSARRLTADGWRSLKPLAAAGAIAVGLMVANALATGWFFLLAGLLVIATPGPRRAPDGAGGDAGPGLRHGHPTLSPAGARRGAADRDVRMGQSGDPGGRSVHHPARDDGLSAFRPALDPCRVRPVRRRPAPGMVRAGVDGTDFRAGCGGPRGPRMVGHDPLGPRICDRRHL
jgi:hypothetical protein